MCEVSDAHFGFVQVSDKSRDLQMLPPAADESEVRGYIFRFLSQLSILAPGLGLGEIATVLSCAVLGSLGKDLMSDITCVWKQTGMTCLLVDHEAQNATAVLVVDIMAVESHVVLASSCAIKPPVTGVYVQILSTQAAAATGIFALRISWYASVATQTLLT